MHSLRLRLLRFSAATLITAASICTIAVTHAADNSFVSSESSSSSDDNTHNALAGSGMNLQPGVGTIIIDQISGSGSQTIGEWTLITPTNDQQTGSRPSTVITDAHAGNYTIFTKLPTGASANFRVYRNDNIDSIVDKTQTTFRLGNDEAIHIVIHYTITNVGQISVQSDPIGLSFHMTGPNDSHFTGVTPASFQSVAAGQYQVQYDQLDGCSLPSPQSLKLQENSRIDFNIRISCATADALRAKQQQNQTNDVAHISITSGGQTAVINDVPQNAWFAPYVVSVAKFGILSGYQDAKGKLTGEYGPSNNVTVAELAKIAHKIAGVSVDPFLKRLPINTKAQGAWYSPYIASAEDQGWTIYSSATVDPNRPATRGEVLVTLLQALDVPLAWQTGTVFTDVNRRTAYAGAIETASAAGLVDGRKDANGNLTNEFGPADPINRAELAKILSQMIDTYKTVGTGK